MIPSLNVYNNQPPHFQNMTFIQYLTRITTSHFKMSCSKWPRKLNVYTYEKLTKFTYLYSTQNIKRFFYKTLLRNVTSRDIQLTK